MTILSSFSSGFQKCCLFSCTAIGNADNYISRCDIITLAVFAIAQRKIGTYIVLKFCSMVGAIQPYSVFYKLHKMIFGQFYFFFNQNIENIQKCRKFLIAGLQSIQFCIILRFLMSFCFISLHSRSVGTFAFLLKMPEYHVT